MTDTTEFPLALAERACELFIYDSGTGHFIRRARVGMFPAGSIAGSRHYKGYVIICANGRKFLAHRLAWFYVHGEWPAEHIDHINGVRWDNRLANLRPATNSQNGANSFKLANHTSGVRGVRSNGADGWRVTVGGKHVGYFSDLTEATEARKAAALARYGDFAMEARSHD